MKLEPIQLIERYDKLKADRAVWESHWQEVADHVLPNKSNILRFNVAGSKRNVTLLDNTAMMSNELLAGALHGLLTNPYGIWFDLTTGHPELDSNDKVRFWLQDSTRRMHNVLNDSNFQTEVHEYYIDLCGFGTGCISMEEDQELIVRFAGRFIGTFVVEEDSKGLICATYREIEWSARQLVQEFGIENVGEKVQKAYEKGLEDNYKVIHGVYPKDKSSKYTGPITNFDYISQYVIRDNNFELKVEGFNESPNIVGRWSKVSGEKYGRGPGMTALPEAKIINKMTETIIKAAQKVVDPPLQMPDEGFIMPIRTKPGGFNYYRAGTTDRIEPVFNKEIRVDFGYEAMNQHRERIRQAFYVDQLLLSNTGPQMTATEVTQRTEERMRLLGPMLGRQNSEFLSPMINRLFKIMDRRGIFLPIPQELAKIKGLSVQYSSVIARMQRVSEGQNIDRTMAALQPFVAFDPSIVDNFAGDKALRRIAGIYGFPQDMIRDMADVKKIREAKQAAQQEMKNQMDQQHQADQLQKVAPAIGMLNKQTGT